MHAVEQLAHAVVDAISAAIPTETIPGGVHTNGAGSWDRRSYPMALVAIGRTRIFTKRSGADQGHSRLQVRQVELIVEFAAKEKSAADLASRMPQLVSYVETALNGFDGVPVDDIDLMRDEGLSDVVKDGEGYRGTQTIAFAVSLLTIEGRPDVIVEPNR